MALALAGFQDNLALAREYALFGDYEGASILYTGLIQQLELLLDPSSGVNSENHSRISQSISNLKSERDLVSCLKLELGRFSTHSSPPREAPSHVPSFDDYPSHPSSRRHILDEDPPAPFRPIPSKVRKNVSNQPAPRIITPPKYNHYDQPPVQPRGPRKDPVPVRNQPDRQRKPVSHVSRLSAPTAASAAKSKVPPKSTHEDQNPSSEKPKFRCFDDAMAERIEREMIDRSLKVRWNDIAGLSDAKRVLHEAIVLPRLRPDFFTGIRRPWRGVLLHGPPGTGKTLLAKAVANECNSTFFSISAATLVNKYLGESEKMVRILFEMARFYAPSVVFFDEIDAVFSSRGKDGEHEAGRRIKSQLLVMMEGISNDQIEEDEEGEENNDENVPSKVSKHVMVLAATNFPWDLDEALRRRLEKRVYIPLPDESGRRQLLQNCLKDQNMAPDVDFERLVSLTDGYSGADITNICRDASFAPLRKAILDLSPEEIHNLDKDKVDTVFMSDFIDSLDRIKPSVDKKDIQRHESWAAEFGSK
ncbi:hypothetical protein RCL1_003763 [Eukaryota sp. TZLM3-RCL]